MLLVEYIVIHNQHENVQGISKLTSTHLDTTEGDSLFAFLHVEGACWKQIEHGAELHKRVQHKIGELKEGHAWK